MLVLKCKKCGDIIYSKSQHDFKTCTCKSIFVDGGEVYSRYGGNPEDIEIVETKIRRIKNEKK